MHFLSVVGARPNFMKLASVSKAIEAHGGIKHTVVHTGQHYSKSLSEDFFTELGLREPDYNLGVGSGGRYWQVSEMTKRLGALVEKEKPDVVLAYGDTNSALATALAANSLAVPLAPVEEGLGSFDRYMP